MKGVVTAPAGTALVCQCCREAEATWLTDDLGHICTECHELAQTVARVLADPGLSLRPADLHDRISNN